MEINGEFKLKAINDMLKDRGLEEMGKVQKFIDIEVIKQMRPYTPFQSGTLANAPMLGGIGKGKIVQDTPYARYLYYGEVYGTNYPIVKNGIVEGFYSPPKKEPTGRELEYNKATHPKAGKLWFERMKADHKDDILKGAREIAGGKR